MRDAEDAIDAPGPEEYDVSAETFAGKIISARRAVRVAKASALGNGSALALALARVLADARDSADAFPAAATFASALPLARDLARDLAFARDIAFARDLADDDTFAVLLVNAVADARVLADADDIAEGRILAHDLDFAHRGVGLAAITSKIGRDIVRAVGLLLDRIAVDASGADLTNLSNEDREALAGVVWNDQTRWPPVLERWVREHSDEFAPGQYRVSGGSDRGDIAAIEV